MKSLRLPGTWTSRPVLRRACAEGRLRRRLAPGLLLMLSSAAAAAALAAEPSALAAARSTTEAAAIASPSTAAVAKAAPASAAVAALGAGAVVSSGEPSSPDWTERVYMLGKVRWWIAPDSVQRLRALAPASLAARVEWAVPRDDGDDTTDYERDQLQAAKMTALRGGAAPGERPRPDEQPSPGEHPAAATGPTPAGAFASASASASASGEKATGATAYRIVARVTEIWRPNRLLNLLIVALPGPGAPFVTQGGAAAEIELVDTARGVPVAGFSCRQYAGISEFLNAFGRIGHARSALEGCASLFLATLRAGTVPEAPMALTPGGALPADAPAADAPAATGGDGAFYVN